MASSRPPAADASSRRGRSKRILLVQLGVVALGFVLVALLVVTHPPQLALTRADVCPPG